MVSISWGKFLEAGDSLEEDSPAAVRPADVSGLRSSSLDPPGPHTLKCSRIIRQDYTKRKCKVKSLAIHPAADLSGAAGSLPPQSQTSHDPRLGHPTTHDLSTSHPTTYDLSTSHLTTYDLSTPQPTSHELSTSYPTT